MKENHKALADGCNVAVGTPGRVKFLMKEGALKVSASKTLVLDSADWLMAPVFQVCVCVCVYVFRVRLFFSVGIVHAKRLANDVKRRQP